MTVQPATQATAAPLMPSSITQYVADYHALSELMRVAVRTDFVPKAFRPEAFIPRENRNPTQQQLAEAFEKSVASATIGAHYGISIGVGSDPFSALQNVHVVNGKPGLYAEAAVSLVQSKGHDVWTEDLTDTRAVVCGRRVGSDHVERVVITMDQARKAGWTRNATYQSTPQDMLYARAASRVCRRVAADALKGIGFAEELHDEETPPPPTNGTRMVQRARQQAAVAAAPPVQQPAPAAPPVPGDAVVTAVEEQPQRPAPPAASGPPLPGEDVPSFEQQVDESHRRLGVPEPNMVTRPQLSQIAMLLGGRHALGGTGSVAKRGRILSALVGRPLKTTQELTADEAGRVIGYLENTDTPALLAMADPTVGPEQEPGGSGSDPWDEPAGRDGTEQ